MNLKSFFAISIILLFGGSIRMLAYDQEYSMTTVEANVSITAAGSYLISSENPEIAITAYTIAVAEDIAGDVNITLRDVNIKSSPSAFLIGANTLVNLTLEGANNLEASNGCGIQTNGSITISGSGSLTAKGKGNRGSGIGQLSSTAMGNITINGGTINAESTTEASGIGGGNGGAVGTITINGGQIVAKGGYYAAGIGGGYVCSGGSVIITGGTVSARAGTYNTAKNNGIGQGTGHNGMTVTITGGSIKTLDTSGNLKEAGIWPIPKNSNDEELAMFQYTVPEIVEPTLISSGNVGNITLGADYGINSTYTDAAGNLYFWLIPQEPEVSVTINTTVTNVAFPKEGSLLARVYSMSNSIIVENATDKKIQIFDITGKSVVSKIITKASEIIQLPQRGVFLVKMEDDNKIYKMLVK